MKYFPDHICITRYYVAELLFGPKLIEEWFSKQMEEDT
jgi:hypothetical protein